MNISDSPCSSWEPWTSDDSDPNACGYLTPNHLEVLSMKTTNNIRDHLVGGIMHRRVTGRPTTNRQKKMDGQTAFFIFSFSISDASGQCIKVHSNLKRSISQCSFMPKQTKCFKIKNKMFKINLKARKRRGVKVLHEYRFRFIKEHMFSDRWFHSLGAATQKVRSPQSLDLGFGTDGVSYTHEKLMQLQNQLNGTEWSETTNSFQSESFQICCKTGLMSSHLGVLVLILVNKTHSRFHRISFLKSIKYKLDLWVKKPLNAAASTGSLRFRIRISWRTRTSSTCS